MSAPKAENASDLPFSGVVVLTLPVATRADLSSVGGSVRFESDVAPREMVLLDGVEKRFGGNLMLAPTTLVVVSGTCLALVGPSGSGKSTLLRLMLGLLVPDAGTLTVAGTPVTPTTATAVRRRVGYVIQDGGLFPHLTGRANVTLLARHLGWPAPRVHARVAELAALVRLELPLLDRYPAQLSGGERQRVGLMRALMLDPPLLLLDEPMAALDPMIRAHLQLDLKRIFAELAKTVVLVTHSLGEAALLGDEVALMHAGRVVERGTMRDLASSADPFAREFVDAQRGEWSRNRGSA
jgi:osmoprotectant transport system ATP-binding protein